MVDEIHRIGGRADSVEADLSDDDSHEAVFDFAEARFGAVDILVNNASSWVADTFAGGGPDRFSRHLTPVSVESIDRAMGSALMIAKYAERHRRHGLDWGRIVGVTSGGSGGFPEEVSYGAAKAAMENFTMSAARELLDRGVTANVVHPPVTDTGWVAEEVRRQINSEVGGSRIATPEEVAAVIAILCSDEASLITGNRIGLR